MVWAETRAGTWGTDTCRPVPPRSSRAKPQSPPRQWPQKTQKDAKKGKTEPIPIRFESQGMFLAFFCGDCPHARSARSPTARANGQQSHDLLRKRLPSLSGRTDSAFAGSASSSEPLPLPSRRNRPFLPDLRSPKPVVTCQRHIQRPLPPASPSQCHRLPVPYSPCFAFALSQTTRPLFSRPLFSYSRLPVPYSRPILVGHSRRLTARHVPATNTP